MPEQNPTEVVGIMRIHLQEILSAIDWARGQNEALDLAEGYRAGHPAVRSSRLTTALNRSYNHLIGYLDTEEDDVPVQ